MVDTMLATNRVTIEGKVVSDLMFSHEMYGEGFYTFKVEIPRLSETGDELPVTVSDRLIASMSISNGDQIMVEGQLRSYNKFVDGANRLVLTVFARDVKVLSEVSRTPNQIFMDGFICKAPVYRTTPFGREITDLLVAVNRPYNKSDYIPAIAWGRNARFSNMLEVGAHIKIWGRIQSRQYEKKVSEENVIKRTAYEVSISKMEKVDENEKSDEDENIDEVEDINAEQNIDEGIFKE